MNRKVLAIGTGAALGLVLGVAMRVLLLTSLAKPVVPTETREEPAAQPPKAATPVEIRRMPPVPSAAAQAAVESGATQFVLRPGRGCDQGTLVDVLLSMGALAIAKQGSAISVLQQGTWGTVTNLAIFDKFAANRAFETSLRSLGAVGGSLPASAQPYLLLPVAEESRLIGAVESVLTTPIQNCPSIEIHIARTAGGHIRWSVARLVRADGTQLQTNLELAL